MVKMMRRVPLWLYVETRAHRQPEHQDKEKACPVSLAATGAGRGEHSQKPTSAGVTSTRAGLTSTYPGKRTRQSWQALLSLRLLGRARYGADNETLSPLKNKPK